MEENLCFGIDLLVTRSIGPEEPSELSCLVELVSHKFVVVPRQFCCLKVTPQLKSHLEWSDSQAGTSITNWNAWKVKLSPILLYSLLWGAAGEGEPPRLIHLPFPRISSRNPWPCSVKPRDAPALGRWRTSTGFQSWVSNLSRNSWDCLIIITTIIILKKKK